VSTRWRPTFPPPRGVVAKAPGPGQESVWDYPRPPRVEAVSRRVVVRLGGGVVFDTSSPLRVLETSHPPTYYLPLAGAGPGALREADGESFCEFKGQARYLDVVGPDGTVAAKAAWTYPDPDPQYAALVGHVALYPGLMQEVTLDGEPVAAQEGDFYGGWVTPEVVGPMKGGRGTWGW